jgi:hypothetical protein
MLANGSLLIPIYTGLEELRLKTITDIDQRQVRFIPVSGSSTNLFIFDESIREVKKKGIIIDSLVDVAKTFNAVPHTAILRTLSCQGVYTIVYIKDMYTGICSQVNLEGSYIYLVRGVKQVTPQSPQLSNIVMDLLIRGLQRKSFRIGGHEVRALASADDIILADSIIEGPRIMEMRSGAT